MTNEEILDEFLQPDFNYTFVPRGMERAYSIDDVFLLMKQARQEGFLEGKAEQKKKDQDAGFAIYEKMNGVCPACGEELIYYFPEALGDDRWKSEPNHSVNVNKTIQTDQGIELEEIES